MSLYAHRLQEQDEQREQEVQASAARLGQLRRHAHEGHALCPGCGSDWPYRILARGCPTCAAIKGEAAAFAAWKARRR